MSQRLFFISLAAFFLASCGNSADDSKLPAATVEHDTVESAAPDLATRLAATTLRFCHSQSEATGT